MLAATLQNRNQAKHTRSTERSGCTPKGSFGQPLELLHKDGFSILLIEVVRGTPGDRECVPIHCRKKQGTGTRFFSQLCLFSDQTFLQASGNAAENLWSRLSYARHRLPHQTATLIPAIIWTHIRREKACRGPPEIKTDRYFPHSLVASTCPPSLQPTFTRFSIHRPYILSRTTMCEKKWLSCRGLSQARCLFAWLFIVRPPPFAETVPNYGMAKAHLSLLRSGATLVVISRDTSHLESSFQVESFLR